MIYRASIKSHDEPKRCEIKRVVDKSLIEKSDGINEDADPHYYQPQQKIPVPDASYHCMTSRLTGRIRPASSSFSKLFLQGNHVARDSRNVFHRSAGRGEPIGEQKSAKDN